MSNIRGLVLWSCAINIKEATTLFITHLAPSLYIYIFLYITRDRIEKPVMCISLIPECAEFPLLLCNKITGDVSADRGV